MRIAIIGKGRVATHLSGALLSAGHDVVMCGGRNRLQPVPEDTELLILSVNDDSIAQVSQEFVESKALVVHTSGSIAMDTILSSRHGVLYPMQTFSFDRDVDFRKVPLFLEAATEADLKVLSQLASTISDKWMPMNGEQRKTMHLAAVLCCNFVNHLYEISYDVLQEKGIPFDVLFPLIEETNAKIHTLTPHEAQTGPALRGDERVMQWHESMLQDSTRKEIYRKLSDSIRETFSV